MRPALSRVPGVGTRRGAVERHARDRSHRRSREAAAAGLTVDDVADALKGANQLAPVGRYPDDGLQHLVLASGLWESVDDIARHADRGQGRRDACAWPTWRRSQPGAPDRTSLIVGDGRIAANISVSQQIGANILDVRAGVEAGAHGSAQALPAGLQLDKTYDLAEFVATAIANVRDAILIGGVLAVLVLLVFLRNWRLTIVASVTLPLTVMATFFFMWLFGESINVMSMGGLAVAIGLVIDDAVVVVENIHRASRRRRDGRRRRSQSRRGSWSRRSSARR